MTFQLASGDQDPNDPPPTEPTQDRGNFFAYSPPPTVDPNTNELEGGTVVAQGRLIVKLQAEPVDTGTPGIVSWYLETFTVRWNNGQLLEPGPQKLFLDVGGDRSQLLPPYDIQDCFLPDTCAPVPALRRPCVDFAARITRLPEVIGNERGTTFRVDTQVANSGPDAIGGQLAFTGRSANQLFDYTACAPCPVPVLASGASHRRSRGLVRLRRSIRAGDRVATGFVGLSAIGTAALLDWNPANDRHDTRVRYASPGDSSANTPREPVTGFSGKARAASASSGQARAAQTSLNRRIRQLRRVDVAVLRTSSRKCTWLKNRRGRFVRRAPRAGSCNRPVWLRAKGTRRWRYRLAKQLPRGRYRLYSRATSKAGISEGSFSRRDRNRVAFRVRGRRR
jgi:hypothetical protein